MINTTTAVPCLGRTCGLGHLDQAPAEDAPQPGLHDEVLGPACHGDEEAGDVQAPVLGHEAVDHAGRCVLGQAHILRESGPREPVSASSSAAGRPRLRAPALGGPSPWAQTWRVEVTTPKWDRDLEQQREPKLGREPGRPAPHPRHLLTVPWVRSPRTPCPSCPWGRASSAPTG